MAENDKVAKSPVVECRVLAHIDIDGVRCAPDAVVKVDPALYPGAVDATPEAVAYAKSLAKKK